MKKIEHRFWSYLSGSLLGHINPIPLPPLLRLPRALIPQLPPRNVGLKSASAGLGGFMRAFCAHTRSFAVKAVAACFWKCGNWRKVG